MAASLCSLAQARNTVLRAQSDRPWPDGARCTKVNARSRVAAILVLADFAMARRALITGITGQDGSYLAELLLSKGYEVHGMVRRSSEEKFERIAHLKGRIQLHQGDLLDQFSLARLLSDVKPDEVYNLAAQSFVPTSWNQPTLTGEFTALGVTKMLEAMRYAAPSARFYQASS